MIVALILLVWTIASVWYAIYNLGNKNRKTSKFRTNVEYVLVAPALLIACIIGWINRS